MQWLSLVMRFLFARGVEKPAPVDVRLIGRMGRSHKRPRPPWPGVRPVAQHTALRMAEWRPIRAAGSVLFGAGGGREDRGAAARERAAHESRKQQARDGRQRSRRAARSAPRRRPCRHRGSPRRPGRAWRRSTPWPRPREQLAGGEALGGDEPGEHRTDVDTVGVLLGVQRVAPTGERELARRIGAAAGPRATRAAVLETLTIALGAHSRNSGSSASVRRTGASKLSSIVRCTLAYPPSPNGARQAAPALLTSSVRRPPYRLAARAPARARGRPRRSDPAPGAARGGQSVGELAQKRSSRRATSRSDWRPACAGLPLRGLARRAPGAARSPRRSRWRPRL